MFPSASSPGSALKETPTVLISKANAPVEPETWNEFNPGVFDTHGSTNADPLVQRDIEPIAVACIVASITDGGGIVKGPVAPVMRFGDEMWLTAVLVVESTTALHTDASKLQLTLTTDIPTFVRMAAIVAVDAPVTVDTRLITTRSRAGITTATVGGAVGARETGGAVGPNVASRVI
jgi:hypothetical protein